MDAENKKYKSKIYFLGGADSVTGSNFLLEDVAELDIGKDKSDKKTKILVDCGLFQGSKLCDKENRNGFSYDPASIDVLFITHAHIDHIGRVPRLVREGFRGVIYSTPPTKEISELMLLDSVDILRREAEEDGLPTLYEEKDVVAAMRLWKTVPYHTDIRIPGGFNAHLKDAGHILGSAMIDISRAGRRLVFTGDLGNSPAPILHNTESIEGANYVVMESVYGDKNHENMEERDEILEDMIEEAINRGGAVMVPAFSLERTQVLLYEINNLVENKKIPSVPIFLDSPLAIKVVGVYKRNNSYFNKKASDIIKSGDDIFNFPRLVFTESREKSMAIADAPNPKIIIAGSGMSNGGRIVHHMKRYLSDPRSTVFLVGYQAVGTRGRELQEGAKSVSIFGKKIPVRARIVCISGYSAHKDSDGLIEFIQKGSDNIESVFIAMCEPGAGLFLAQRLRDYAGVNASVPQKGDSVMIDF